MKVNAEVDTLLNKIVKDLEDVKAKDIQIINIKNRSALGDYMIIVSGTSSRHINSTDWLIVDFGDIILNVFKPETREHYSLEKIWKHNDLEDEKFGFG